MAAALAGVIISAVGVNPAARNWYAPIRASVAACAVKAFHVSSAMRTVSSERAQPIVPVTWLHAIQMAAGYEGKGYSIGGGGTYLVYDIRSQHLGKNNSEVIIGIKYRHIIGTEGSCYY